MYEMTPPPSSPKNKIKFFFLIKILFTFLQCCGSRSTCFWDSWLRIRIHQWDVWIRIRLRIWILQSPCKKIKKNHDSYCFVTYFWLFIIFKYLQKVISRKNKIKNKFFVGILGRSMIKMAGSGSASGSGFTSKCHGSAKHCFSGFRFTALIESES
jgi:hypothetical protein